MKKCILINSMTTLFYGCITVPVVDDSHTHKCELSTNMKVLNIVDVAKETNSFYSFGGVILSPILIPTSAIISGTYVLVNNTYHLGEKEIKCGENETEGTASSKAKKA